MFQVPGRRAASLRIGRYTNFLDTTYFFGYLHKTVGNVLYFSSNSCSSIDLNFVFVLPIECSSTVGRSNAPCLRMSFRSSFNWPLLSRQRPLRSGWRM